MGKKKLTEKDWWAQQIVRIEQNDKEFLFALVRRRYSSDDIEPVGPGKYIGAKTVSKYAIITDKDPDSDTFGERIQKPDSEPTGTRIVFQDEVNEANIKKYKAMADVNSFGQTRYEWKFKMQSTQANSAKQFWELTVDEAYKKFVLKEQVIKIEDGTNKSNNRRRTVKAS
jgi:hypothetical protein